MDKYSFSILRKKKGSSHSLANYNYTMHKDSKDLKNLLNKYPPYVIKLSSNFEKIFQI